MGQNISLKPHHGPPKEVKLGILRDVRQVSSLDLDETRLDLDRPLLEYLPIPQLLPTVGRVTEHCDTVRVWAIHLSPQSFLRSTPVRP